MDIFLGYIFENMFFDLLYQNTKFEISIRKWVFNGKNERVPRIDPCHTLNYLRKERPYSICHTNCEYVLIVVVLAVPTSFGLMVTVGLVHGQKSEELRAAVGRRLAVADHHSSQVALGDGEDSPLQSSKRSSTCFYIDLRFCIFFMCDQLREFFFNLEVYMKCVTQTIYL